VKLLEFNGLEPTEFQQFHDALAQNEKALDAGTPPGDSLFSLRPPAFAKGYGVASCALAEGIPLGLR